MVEQSRWNSEVEQCWWKSVVEQWKSVGGTVWWNSGTVMKKQCGGTVEQSWWHTHSGTVKQ